MLCIKARQNSSCGERHHHCLCTHKQASDCIQRILVDEFGSGFGTAAKAVHVQCALSNASPVAKAQGISTLLEFIASSKLHRSESSSTGERACLEGIVLVRSRTTIDITGGCKAKIHHLSVVYEDQAFTFAWPSSHLPKNKNATFTLLGIIKRPAQEISLTRVTQK